MEQSHQSDPMLRLLIAECQKDNIPEIEKIILEELNPNERSRFLKYNFKNRLHKTLGWYLLKQQLGYFQKNMTIFDLKRNAFYKPYFENTAFHFSISHSKDHIVCLASDSLNVGIDIEFEDKTLTNFDSEFFSLNERAILKKNQDYKLFYHLHTRKEAFSKAVGLGIFLEHELFDVQNDSVVFKDTEWHLTSLNLINGYSLSYATNNKKALLETIEMVI